MRRVAPYVVAGSSLSPGTKDDSLKRAAEELEWRAQAAERAGVQFAIEAHLGSIVPTPGEALQLPRTRANADADA